MVSRTRVHKIGFLLFAATFGFNGIVYSQSFLYWTETDRPGSIVASGSLMRSNPDGTGIQTVLTSENLDEVPTASLAFDPVNGHIYTGNASELFRLDLDGTNRVDLVSSLVLDVEVDLLNGKVYWSDLRGVNRADLDGNNSELLTPANLVEGIALDPVAEKVYFTLNGGATHTIEVM